MLINLTEYVKNGLFDDIQIDEKFCIISDTDIVSKNWKVYKVDALEPVWQIVALKEKYKLVFVVLDRLNYDNIYRLYKNDISGICILNLNSWYTGIWKKTIMPDLDDIYIKENVEVCEPMDKENLLFLLSEFISNKKLTHIRVANKEMEEKIWQDEVTLEYKEIINFNQFWITGFNWTLLVYGSLLQEWLNVAGLLQAEGFNIDMFWIWNYKKDFSSDLIQSLENQDTIFVLWDFSKEYFKDFLYSRFYDAGIVKEDVYFVCPENTEKQVVNEFLAESVNMDPVKIYERIKNIK